ncbi:MAG: L,D-transpeptidase family protein [Arcanobacterium sp.]|nr:L,D-transpeptidase family protein [Arcanobacterium sp.]
MLNRKKRLATYSSSLIALLVSASLVAPGAYADTSAGDDIPAVTSQQTATASSTDETTPAESEQPSNMNASDTDATTGTNIDAHDPTSNSNPSANADGDESAPEETQAHWEKTSSGWIYITESGDRIIDSAVKIGGTTYVFNKDGVLARGWYQTPNKAWYYSPSVNGAATGWYKTGSWYYLDPNTAKMREGWLYDDGKWYYLRPGSGAMATGWLKTGGKWYWLSSSGAMATGWVKTGGHWYYLAPSGAMATGWEKVGGSWYYLNSSGAMATGWLKTGGKWYWLSSSGAMATGWVKTGGEWYWLTDSGAMATGWYKAKGQWNYSDRYTGRWVSSRSSLDSDMKAVRGLYSKTNYLIYVNRDRPSCTVFYWTHGGWEPFKDIPCSVGKSSTPTPRGQYTINYHLDSFGKGYTVWYATQFTGAYFFHSILYNPGSKTSVQDGTLGGHVSHGCIRMPLDSAKWIWQHAPIGTTVKIS